MVMPLASAETSVKSWYTSAKSIPINKVLQIFRHFLVHLSTLSSELAQINGLSQPEAILEGKIDGNLTGCSMIFLGLLALLHFFFQLLLASAVDDCPKVLAKSNSHAQDHL